MVVLGQIPSYPSLVLMTLSPFWDKFDSVGVASDFAKSSPITQSETTLEKSIWSSSSRLSIERESSPSQLARKFSLFWDRYLLRRVLDSGPSWKVVGRSTFDTSTFVLFYCHKPFINLSIHEAIQWCVLRTIHTIHSRGCFLGFYIEKKFPFCPSLFSNLIPRNLLIGHISYQKIYIKDFLFH